MNASNPQAFYTSLVLEHIVSKEQEPAFRQWHQVLMQTAEQQPGFVRSDRCPPLPCTDGVVKWYDILHFDSPQHLQQWIRSKQRQRLVKSGQGLFRVYRFKSFTTGLEGWFSRRVGAEQDSLGPPAWKQILAVVLGLYPIIMVQSWLFRALGIMTGWPLARAMLVNNLITSTVLALVVMPWIAQLLSFWLRSADRRTSWRTNLLGLGAIAAILLGLVAVFERLA